MNLDEELDAVVGEYQELRQKAVALHLKIEKRMKIEDAMELSPEEAEALLCENDWDLKKTLAMSTSQKQEPVCPPSQGKDSADE